MLETVPFPSLAVLAGLVAVVASTALLAQEIARRRNDTLLRRWEIRSQALEQALAAAPDGWFAWLPSSDKPLPSSLSFDEPLLGGLCSRRLAVMLDLAIGQEASFAHILEGFDDTDSQRLINATLSLRSAGDAFDITLSHYPSRRNKDSDEAEESRDDRRVVRVVGRQALADDGTPIADILWVRDISGDQETSATLAAEVSHLRHDHNRLQRALDALPLPVWLRDADLRIFFANRSFRQGIAREEGALQAPEDHIPELAAGQTALEMRALASAARAAGQPRTTNFPLVLDGSLKQMTVSEIPVPPPARDPDTDLFTVGLAEDRTPISALEATLEHESASHANVLQRLGTAIAIFGDDTRLHFHNAAFSQLWKLDESWLADRPRYSEFLETLRTRRLMPEVPDWPAFRDVELGRFKSLVDPLEDLLHLPDDQTLRRVLAPHPLGGLLATYENVTDRLALEASLNTLVAVHKESLSHLSEAVVVFSADGHLTLCNTAFCTLWAIAPEAVVNQPTLSELVPLLPKGDGHAPSPEVWEEVHRLLAAPPQDRAVRRRWITNPDCPPIAVAGIPLPDGGVMFTFMSAGAVGGV